MNDVVEIVRSVCLTDLCLCSFPQGKNASDVTGDGWRLVFRQTLPSRDPIHGGYFRAQEWRKNADKPTSARLGWM